MHTSRSAWGTGAPCAGFVPPRAIAPSARSATTFAPVASRSVHAVEQLAQALPEGKITGIASERRPLARWHCRAHQAVGPSAPVVRLDPATSRVERDKSPRRLPLPPGSPVPGLLAARRRGERRRQARPGRVATGVAWPQRHAAPRGKRRGGGGAARSSQGPRRL